MKTQHIITGLALCIALFSTSCENLLKEKPHSIYTENNFYTSLAQAEMGVIGIYDLLGTVSLYGQVVSCMFQADTDLSQIKGSQTGDNSKRDIGHYAIAANNQLMRNAWRDYYYTIGRANAAIVGMSQMDILTSGTDEQKELLMQYLGEAHFLRGLCYFDLHRFWGEVPMPTEPITSGHDFNTPRSSHEDLYRQIVSDFSFAKKHLKTASDMGTNQRATTHAARFYLVRTYMQKAGYTLQKDGQSTRPENYIAYYQQAALEADSIIKSGLFKLNPSYEMLWKNFAANTLDVSENLFEICFAPMGINAENSGFISTYIGPKVDANSSYGRANAYVNAMWPFYDSYQDGDSRKEIAVAPYEVKADNSYVDLTTKAKNYQKIYPGKWRREWNATPPAYTNDTDVNWVLARYADVLLLYAEAINACRSHLPVGLSMNDAYDAVDLVRRRAFGDEDNDWPRDLSQDDFFEKMIEERAWELCFEGWRKWDLIRWNIMKEKLLEMEEAAKEAYSKYPYPAAVNFTVGKHEYYPIPQRDMDANTALTEQNPGYGG